MGSLVKPPVGLQMQELEPYSWLVVAMFLVFAVYSTVPLVDIPRVGLSLSAPLFFFVTLQVIARPPEAWREKYSGWIFLCAIFWIGMLLSVAINTFTSGGVNFDTGAIIALVRHAYWFLVMIISVYFVERTGIGPRLVPILSFGIFSLALIRLGEAVIYGRIGAYSDTQVLLQNVYGILFSTFACFLIAFFITQRGWMKLAALVMLLTTWAAIAINGSRGSWIGVGMGFITFFVLYLLLKPSLIGRVFPLLIVIVIFFLGLRLLPENYTNPLTERFASFSDLESQKPFAVRQFMIQKSWRLFLDSPIYGVGLDRFRKTTIDIDMPEAIQYLRQDLFDQKAAHNSYAALLAETGLIGMLPYAILILILLFRGFSSALYLGRQNEIWALAVYASFIAMSIHMWAVDSITNTSTWMIYGFVIATIMIAAQQKKATAAPEAKVAQQIR